MTNEIKVMLVDDSAVIRGFLSRALTEDPKIDIVASVSNGKMAVDMIERTQPDVIILDIEMPVMDGIEAIPHLLERKPGTKILMCSTLSAKGASITMKALSIGATDCIVKPSNTTGITSGPDFQKELLNLVHSLVNSRPTPKQDRQESQQDNAPIAKTAGSAPTIRNNPADYKGKPSIIAVGSSTGGPQALFKVLPHFKDFDVPIIITQHMPKTFTTILAQHIQSNCNLPAKEAEEDMVLEPGTAYVAPGGFHMVLKKNEQSRVVTKITDTPPENFCKPSVDPMMRSAIDIYGNKVLGVMLTGMGSDGLKSFTELTERGGRIIAQDEKTSVVWGMPGAVAQKGICSAILPLEEIGPWVKRVVN